METRVRPLRARGFTLLELVVSLLVAGLILMLSVQLLREVQGVFIEAQRRAPEPLVELALRLVASDARGASDAIGAVEEWSSGELLLGLPDGRRIGYRRSDGRLQREVISADGSHHASRTLLPGVASWSFRQLFPGLVEVRVGVRRRDDLGRRRFAGLGRRSDSGLSVDTLYLRCALRSRSGRGSW